MWHITIAKCRNANAYAAESIVRLIYGRRNGHFLEIFISSIVLDYIVVLLFEYETWYMPWPNLIFRARLALPRENNKGH